MSLFKEPLVGFFLAGAAIFAVDAVMEPDNASNTIVVTEDHIVRIADQWQAQMNRPPTSSELQGLLDQWLREEIYYREAEARGLDDNDAIIRRRLVQKLTFLTEDLAEAQPPTEEQLLAFYDANATSYVREPQFTFDHRYFSQDRRDDAHADALAALQKPDAAGDPFMLQHSYAARSRQEIGDLFGREFADSLTEFEVSDRWQGPVRSAYGWHLVRLRDHLPAAPRSFAEVRATVTSDFQRQRRAQANDALFDALRANYQIHYPTPAQ